ncbi:MAG: NfeD family protein [Bacteroidaceae bacterium]
MDILIISILFFVSLLLFVVEVFLLPGIGLAGIGAAIGIISANILTFNTYGTGIGLWVMLGSILLCGLLLYWVTHSRTIDHYSLDKSIDSTSANPAQLSIRVGDTGIALNRLALIGNAEIGGKTVEVKSADGFLSEGTPLVVTRVEQALIVVKKVSPTESI